MSLPVYRNLAIVGISNTKQWLLLGHILLKYFAFSYDYNRKNRVEMGESLN
jgi:hypothetical protein